jgi:hypothetical protein
VEDRQNCQCHCGKARFSVRGPPILRAQRGKCLACGRPAIEHMQMFPMPKLIIIPSANILDPAFVPKPSLHIFYNRRVADIDDDLPKFDGYWRNQLAFGQRLVAALYARHAALRSSLDTRAPRHSRR